MQRNMRGIFVEADKPEYLERDIKPEVELVDLNTLNVVDIIEARNKRKASFATAPFDPKGDQIKFFPGGFTVWSGFPGMGKTTILRQFACHLMSEGKKVFLASLEEDPVDVFHRLASVALGVEEPDANGLQWCIDCWHDKLRLWSFRRGIAEHARILAVIRVLAKQGVSHAIIDSLARLDVHSGDWEAQRLFGNVLEASAATANVHIHLVAHPRKLVSADQEPDINDIAGSADIGRLADNVLFVRKKPEKDVMGEFSPMQISVKKQRYGSGSCNSIDGYFNRRLRQFKPHLHDIEVTRYLPGGAYGEIKYT